MHPSPRPCVGLEEGARITKNKSRSPSQAFLKFSPGPLSRLYLPDLSYFLTGTSNLRALAIFISVPFSTPSTSAEWDRHPQFPLHHQDKQTYSFHCKTFIENSYREQTGHRCREMKNILNFIKDLVCLIKL